MSRSVVRRLLSQLSDEDLKLFVEEIMNRLIETVDDEEDIEWWCTDKDVCETVSEWLDNFLSGRKYTEDV